MMMRSYVVILSVTVACFSTGVVCEECGERTYEQSSTLLRCCDFHGHATRKLQTQVDEAVAACREAVPASERDKPLEEEMPQGYECMQQCVFMKLGVQGDDKEMKRDNVLKLVKEVFGKDIRDVAEKAMGECLDESKNAYGSCPDGMSSGADCLTFKMAMNCPDKYWTKSDVCTKEKEYYEKCGPPKRDQRTKE